MWSQHADTHKIEITFVRSLRVGSHGVPSPTHVSKFQHGGKVPTFERQEPFKVDLDHFMQKNSRHLYWELGLAFCSTWLNTNPKPHLQEVLPCRHPCHTWDLRLGTPCEVVSPHFYILNIWDCIDWPQVTWDLGLGTPREHAKTTLLKSVVRYRNIEPSTVTSVWVSMGGVELFASTVVHSPFFIFDEPHNQTHVQLSLDVCAFKILILNLVPSCRKIHIIEGDPGSSVLGGLLLANRK